MLVQIFFVKSCLVWGCSVYCGSSSWIHHATIMGSSRIYHTIITGSSCDSSWVHRGFFTGSSWLHRGFHHGFIMDTSWVLSRVHHEIIKGSSWVHHGIIKGSTWVHHGIIMVSSKDHHGFVMDIIMESSWSHRENRHGVVMVILTHFNYNFHFDIFCPIHVHTFHEHATFDIFNKPFCEHL